MSYGLERFFLLTYCLACCWPGLGAKTDLRVVRQWTTLEFDFPSDADRQAATDKRFYVPGNSVPIDVDVHHRQGTEKSRIFVTIPRFDVGRPVTLGTIDEHGRITGYPDYSWHDNQGENCKGLTSVFRVAIDECNRLWVIDAGKIGDHLYCQPQLLAFDLETDRLIYRHVINESNYIATSLFITPYISNYKSKLKKIVADINTDANATGGGPPRATTHLSDTDTRFLALLGPGFDRTAPRVMVQPFPDEVVDVRGGVDNCQDTYVYVADVSGFAILVVDVANDRAWRVTHRLMFPYPSHGTFTVDNESFDLMDGVLGMALSPYRSGRDRYLYFHALAAITENVVRTKVLRNDSFLHDPNAAPQSINVFPEKRPNQAAAEAMDRSGIMYFGLMEPPSIWCWNSATEFSPRNFYQIAVNRETLQFASGVKVVNNLKGEQELWVLTSSFQRVMTGSLNNERLNYRIHAEKIPNLLVNSPCANPPKGRNHGYHANLIIPNAGYQHGTYRYGAVSYL